MCGKDDAAPYRVSLGYSFVRCRSCGLVYMSPRPAPDGLRSIYTADYFESTLSSCGYAIYRSDRESIREKAFRFLARIERHHPPGRLLDVGCAYGLIMEVARERGWEVEGVEAATDVAEVARRELGVRVHADLVEASLPAASFDAVAMWDVVEHLPDPVGSLREARRLLRPGGVLSLIVPDLGSLAARLLGGRWEEWQKMPEHILFFDRRTLAELLRRGGFAPLEWGTVGKRMALDEVVTRLEPVGRPPMRALRALLRATGLAGRVFDLDPGWKAFLVARPS